MTGRYQSRLLSFLSEQSLHLRDRSSLLWRQATVAIVWGIQIALYPFYVGFQATRVAGKQLRHTVRQTLPRLQAAMRQASSPDREPVHSDSPIRATLAEIQAFQIALPASQIVLQSPLTIDRSFPASSAFVPAQQDSKQARRAARQARREARQKGKSALQQSNPQPPTPTLQVRAIATLLDTRTLVLVTTQNQLLDILTPQQQLQLQRRMANELLDYWQQRRLAAQLKSDAPLLVGAALPLPPTQPQLILPLRLFYGLMAWEQQGLIARSVNLFQESQLPEVQLPEVQLPEVQLPEVRLPSRENRLAPTSLLPASPTLTPALSLRSAKLPWMPLEDWTAKLKASLRLRDGSSPSLRDGKSVSDRSDWVQGFLALMQLPVQWIDSLLQPTDLVPYSSDARMPSDLTQATASTAQSPAAEQPWLTMEDLFAQMAPSVAPAAVLQWELVDTAAIEAATKAERFQDQQPGAELVPLGQSLSSGQLVLRNRVTGAVVQTHSPSDLSEAAPQTVPQRLAFRTAAISALKDKAAPAFPLGVTRSETIATLSPTSAALELGSTEIGSEIEQVSYIEAKAQLVGYVKHPLEQLLEWLDRGMLWVEQKLEQVWQWLERLRG